jgi:hypothetical protein
MQSFPDMAEAHEWTLRRLREMAGRLTEQAYLRASEAQAPDGGYDAEAAQRWMLVFDRMARGLRLTVALEARLARERRSDAAGIAREIEQAAPRAPQAAPRQAFAEAEPCESDRERDDDGLPPDAPLAQRIDRLKAIIEGTDGVGAEAEPPRRPSANPPTRGLAARLRWAPALPCEQAPPADPPWRGSG